MYGGGPNSKLLARASARSSGSIVVTLPARIPGTSCCRYRVTGRRRPMRSRLPRMLVFLFPVYVGNKKTTNIGKIGLPAVAAPLILLSSDKRAKHGPYKWGARLALAVMICSLANSPCVSQVPKGSRSGLTPRDSPADTFRLWLTHRVAQMHSRPPRILFFLFPVDVGNKKTSSIGKDRPSCRCPAA